MVSDSSNKRTINNSTSLSPPNKPSLDSNGDVSEAVASTEKYRNEAVNEPEGDDEHCVICLQEIRDRTILPCAHDRLCFECIFVWCQQSRKCPLCNAPIGPYLIHNFRSDYDYSKYYLTPLRTSPPPSNLLVRPSETRIAQRTHEIVQWGRRRNAQNSQERADQLELAISKRRWIYRHGLYAMHVASNSHTRYRPAPTPTQFAASQDIITRATIFIRRELRVWINLDVEFLTTFILSLMKSIDIRSESAVKLLAEFLDMDIPYYLGEPDGPSRGRFPNAEHFAHELYSYLRSPFKDVVAYDRAVKYEIPSDIPPPPDKPIYNQHERHWEASPPRAESSRHARREASSSRSPLLRSPREAYSPSPSSSPSDAYDDLHQNQYRSISRPSPRYRRPDDSFTQENNRDVKGKGRTDRTRLRHDTWGSNRVESISRASHRTGAKRQRSVSSARSDERRHKSPPRRKFVNFSREDLPDSSSSSGAVGISFNSPKSAGNAEAKDGQTSTSVLDRPSRDEAVLHDSTSPTDHLPDTPISPNWGISIRGQARLLGGHENTPNHTSSQNGGRKTSEPLHADQLGHSSTARPTNGSLDASSATMLKTGYNNTEASTNKKNDSNSSVNGRDATNLEMTPQNRLSLSLSSDQVVSSTRMSARDIMVRTRARLAKMRGDLSEYNRVNDTPLNTGAINLSATVRNYLLKQLEEEKRKLKEKAKDTVKAHGELGSANYAEEKMETNTAGSPHTEITPDAVHKHDSISREESLRSKLRSRRTGEKGTDHI